MIRSVWGLSVFIILCASCTALKHVPEGERLYTGAKISVVKHEGQGKVNDEGKAVGFAEEILTPRPNKKFLGSRPLLWIWYNTNPKKQKGFKHWVKTKIGEPPVYMSAVDPPLVGAAIEARMYNKGFLTAACEPERIERPDSKTGSVIYHLVLPEPYTINKLIFPEKTDSLTAAIAGSDLRTRIKPGDRYDLDLLLEERARIEERLKRRGYYYFSQEHLLFQMDTTLGTGKLNLYLTLKPEMPERAKMVYHIAAVNVYPDYRSGTDTVFLHKEVIDSVNYFDESHYIRPDPVLRAVFLKNGQIYDKRKHTLTVNRLNGIGVFKFVNVRITDKDTVPGWLNTNIFLSPLPKKSISIEMQGVSKSNNFIGPALTISWRNRNAFRGAELMIYNLRGSFETQFNGVYKGRYTYEFNPRLEIYVPRFMVPFPVKKKSIFVPHTKYIFDYSFLSRVGYFDMNSFKFSFGYKWKEKITIDHDLSVLTLTYFKLSNTTPTFDELIKNNIVMRRRFEEQLISGIAYSFFYNGQVKHRQKNQIYFNGNAEMAGNTFTLYNRMIGQNPSPENPSKIFGINYAQFIKADFEVRDYIKLGPKSLIASRFIAGWGLPFGNSSTMPYIKQFFSGGAYSVRGFQAFSIGPGTYAPPDSLKNLFFLQQGGEIKTEANIEYRFPIVSVLRGAVFADVGNVWLNNENPDIPGGEFRTARFLKELAVGTGVGLRVDLDFFVLRLDMGIPLRKPWLPDGERWVYSDINFASTAWRDENLVFNIAFGYPF